MKTNSIFHCRVIEESQFPIEEYSFCIKNRGLKVSSTDGGSATALEETNRFAAEK